MIIRHLTILVVLLMLALGLAAPALAQSPEVLAEGLLNPRKLSFDAEGNLYVAEAGTAGPLITRDGEAFGASGQVSRINPDGSSDVLVHGLTSFREGDTLGATDIYITDESLWLLLGETSDFTIPFTHALVELDRENGRVQTFVDLLSIELEQDPDGNPNLQSNPVDLEFAPDGTAYIANAGCNCVMSWTPEAGVQIVAVWDFQTDNPVPTSVEIGPEGDLYVGFLTGFPFPQEGSRIERWSGGELVHTYEGLTAVTSVLLAQDGTLYAVEHGVFQQGQGWTPGRVVRVDEGGITPVLENLERPFGLAQSPDGRIVVSVGSAAGANGQILLVPQP